MFFFPFGISCDDIVSPVAVPAVVCSAFLFNFGEFVFFDAVTAAEEWAVGFDFVEPCPHWRCVGVWFDEAVLSCSDEAEADDFR